ncbi:hypothetical protein FHQ08_02845 [Lactobacillus sp. CC-MHH1034]|uniref:hypothetical protein n=1 Tax=Agrilactobacillus fermenti TaxID=2586909 RepID=UPI001E6193A8|nr:hypothetical protein [Agrilactobacillus fermenti]MCD2255651.1 hypothetical protein [Agrilactobacillus fermenti]
MIGLVINAFGNGLCVVAGVGSGLWTAAAVNLNALSGLSVGVFLFIFGMVNTITNQFLIRRVDVPRFIGEVVFVLFFSYFVNIFVNIFTFFGVNTWPWLIRAILSVLGVVIFCIAISIYQRANIFMHPNDDTTNILRFMYLRGNATKSQLLDFIPPITIIIVCVILTRQIYAINIATVFSFLFNGTLIEHADQWVMPKLVHNFKIKTGESD